MIQFRDYMDRLLARKGKGLPAVNAPRSVRAVDDNPLAGLTRPIPPSPTWQEIRHEVLHRAAALADQEQVAARTALIERAQFATAMALFIVIACCIFGLLLPGNIGTGGDELLAEVCNHPAEPVLASYQHP